MHGEPAELWQLYIVISSLRDFNTNIAGVKTAISDRTFKEQLEINGKQGRKKWRPGTSLIQRWLGQLERLGLIEQRRNYVFYCPLASAPKSKKNISDQTATRSATSFKGNKNLGINYKNSSKRAAGESEVRPEVRLELYTPPYIDLTDHDHLSSCIDRTKIKKNFLDGFEYFWDAYPKKVGKKYAQQIWQRKKLSGLTEKIIENVKQKAANDVHWLDGYIPNASTYLNQERWNDEITRARPKNGQSTAVYQSVRDKNAEFFDRAFDALAVHATDHAADKPEN